MILHPFGLVQHLPIGFEETGSGSAIFTGKGVNMHCTSVALNQLLNQYLSLHLKGTELNLITKIFLNLRCEGDRGHDMDGVYRQSLSFTARTVGRSKETVRRSLERLHAQGLITVDGKTWKASLNDRGKRRSTGMIQEIRISKRLKKQIGMYVKGVKNLSWPFKAHREFEKKADKLRAKSREAKRRFMAAYSSKLDPRQVPVEKKRQVLSFVGDAKTSEEFRKLASESARHLVQQGYVEGYAEGVRLISGWMLGANSDGRLKSLIESHAPNQR